MLDIVFVKGGYVMYAIVALSIYVMAVIFYKIRQFTREGVWRKQCVMPAMANITRGEFAAALAVLEGDRGPLVRTMSVAVRCVMNRQMSSKTREAEIARVGTAEIRALESHLRGLEMAAAIGPLLGLLGTVIGMVLAFAGLAQAGVRVDPSLLAGGIWQALITTVGGLVVAVPAMAAYYVFDSVIERVRAAMRDVTTQILAQEDWLGREESGREQREAFARDALVREALAREALAHETLVAHQPLANETLTRKALAREAQARVILKEQVDMFAHMSTAEVSHIADRRRVQRKHAS